MNRIIEALFYYKKKQKKKTHDHYSDDRTPKELGSVAVRKQTAECGVQIEPRGAISRAMRTPHRIL